MPEDDLQVFESIWKQMKEKAKEIFQADGHHSHMIFLIKENTLMVILHAQVVSEIIGDKKEELTEEEKNRVFSTIATVAYEQKATGYIEISEGWGMAVLPDSDMKDAVEQYKAVKENYGYIKNMPTRVEVLYIRGRYRGFSANLIYKIRRAGDEHWLDSIGGADDGSEVVPYTPENITRIGMIDQAVDKVISEERVSS